MPQRRARFPSLLGLLALAIANGVVTAALVVALGVHNATWAGVAGFGEGALVLHLRMMWWRRRHPVITPEEYLRDMRENARWN